MKTEVWAFLQNWIGSSLLVSVRVASLLLFAAPFSSVAIPAMARVAVGLALSVSLATVLSSPSAAPLDPASLWPAMAGELVVGSTMALGVNVSLAVFTLAGRLVDVQVGFGLAQVFDPLTQQQVPVLTSAFNQLAIVLFFASEGHLTALRALAMGLEHVPPGSFLSVADAVPALVEQSAAMFSLGMALVAPVVFCLLLLEIGFGVLARNLPQMNMFVFAIPVRILVALAVMAASVLVVSNVAARIHSSLLKVWGALFL